MNVIFFFFGSEFYECPKNNVFKVKDVAHYDGPLVIGLNPHVAH